jgi:hypothetical protein
MAKPGMTVCAVHAAHPKYPPGGGGVIEARPVDADGHEAPDCEECEGTGECPVCHGTGTCEHPSCEVCEECGGRLDMDHDCGVCDGSGLCEACDGKGYV